MRQPPGTILYELFRYAPHRNSAPDDPVLYGTEAPGEVRQVFDELFRAYCSDGGSPREYGGEKALKVRVGAWALSSATNRTPIPVYVAASMRMLMGLDPFGIDDSKKPHHKHIGKIRRLIALDARSMLNGQPVLTSTKAAKAITSLEDEEADIKPETLAKWRKEFWYRNALVVLGVLAICSAQQRPEPKRRIPQHPAGYEDEMPLITNEK